MEKEKIDQFRLQLEELALEIEDYLRKSKASAEAVEPDKGLGRLSRIGPADGSGAAQEEEEAEAGGLRCP